jgi:hypothetical protein
MEFIFNATADRIKILVADGLGHGREANLAVNEAVNAFMICTETSPVRVIRYLHEQIKRTRGMVGTVMMLDRKQQQWSMAGVGNISAKQIGAYNEKNFISYNGIIGHNIPTTMSNHTFKAEEFQQLILCSDGIKTRWDITKYPAVLKHDQTILASVIYKDYARRTDDMCIVCVKLY